MTDLFKLLAEHTEDLGNYHIDWNPQRACYWTVEQEIQDSNLYDDFQSEEMRQRAIDENQMVVLQWYRHTPVGFLHMAAPDIESLTEWVREWIDQEPKQVEINGVEVPPRLVCLECGKVKPPRGSHVANNGGNPDFCSSLCVGYEQVSRPAIEIDESLV